jgi:hypothetical protein
LLPHFVGIELSVAPQDQLAQALQLTTWAEIIADAEEHGLNPLLYTSLRATAAPLLPKVKRELQSLYLRHRHANQVRAGVLAEILSDFQRADIEVLVLKGAALAHLIYPEPGLRPMRDIDLLVKKTDARHAQSLLAELGFDAPLPRGSTLPDKHLLAAKLKTAGLSVSVEIHHNLFSRGFPASLEIETLTSPPLAFNLNGVTAYTLGYEDMLWHLCCHAIGIIYQPLRLIWVADIVGFAKCFANEINWERIACQYPLVLSTLEQFHHLTPLSETLQQAASLNVGRIPKGIGQEFQGWPRYALAQQRPKSHWRIIQDSFWPSEWWLCLYYGLRSHSALVWYRWVRHPLRILGWIGQLLLERAGWRSAAGSCIEGGI